MKFRYSRWDGSQRLDDLDAGDVLDALSDDLMNYGDLNAALPATPALGIARTCRASSSC